MHSLNSKRWMWSQERRGRERERETATYSLKMVPERPWPLIQHAPALSILFYLIFYFFFPHFQMSVACLPAAICHLLKIRFWNVCTVSRCHRFRRYLSRIQENFCIICFASFACCTQTDSRNRQIHTNSAASSTLIRAQSVSWDLYGGFSSDFNYAKFYGARVQHTVQEMQGIRTIRVYGVPESGTRTAVAAFFCFSSSSSSSDAAADAADAVF